MRATTKSFASLTAADLMSREVTVIPRHLSLRTAAHLLSQARVSGAPVIDASGACVGVISSTDFVHCAEGRHPAPREREATKICSGGSVITAPTERMRSRAAPRSAGRGGTLAISVALRTGSVGFWGAGACGGCGIERLFAETDMTAASRLPSCGWE